MRGANSDVSLFAENHCLNDAGELRPVVLFNTIAENIVSFFLCLCHSTATPIHLPLRQGAITFFFYHFIFNLSVPFASPATQRQASIFSGMTV